MATEQLDLCSSLEINSLFVRKYLCGGNLQVFPTDSYCLKMDANYNWDNIAVSSSDGDVSVIKRRTLDVVSKFNTGKDVTGIKFSRMSNDALYTCSSDGCVRVWDVRTNKAESVFSDKSSKCSKPLLSLDVSSNERILCAGSELVGIDAYLLFWDVRGTKLLGGYWNSHTDDVTQIKFSRQHPDIMASASTDGLMNVYDVSQTNEENALSYCLNAGVSVDQLTWFHPGVHSSRMGFLSALTDMQTCQYWNVEDSAPKYNFGREAVTSTLKRSDMEECYLLGCFPLEEELEEVVILAGSSMDSDGACLRTLTIDPQNGSLQAHGLLENGAKQVVRAVIYLAMDGNFIVAGEGGIVNSFTLTDNSGADLAHMSLKIPTSKISKKMHNLKPY